MLSKDTKTTKDAIYLSRIVTRLWLVFIVYFFHPRWDFISRYIATCLSGNDLQIFLISELGLVLKIVLDLVFVLKMILALIIVLVMMLVLIKVLVFILKTTEINIMIAIRKIIVSVMIAIIIINDINITTSKIWKINTLRIFFFVRYL